MQLIIAAIPYLLQLLCIVHVFKTGRNGAWVYVIIFVPYLGGIAYFFAEILPSLRLKGGIGEAADIVVSRIIPTHRIKRLESRAEFAPTFENERLLADEYLACGYFEKSAALYGSLRAGIHKHNPDVALLEAKALYGAKKYDESGAIISALDATGFEYKKESELLVKLKVLERSRTKEEVYALYRDAKKRFNSFEIFYYYIDYMISRGDAAEARAALDEISEVKRHLDKNRITYQKSWAKKAMSLRFKIR